MDPFNAVALRFCALIEHPPSPPTLAMLQLALLELYGAALRVPAGCETPAIPGIRAEAKMSRRWEKLLAPEFYFEVFDATEDTGTVSGWLYDDVYDIHRDLRDALAHGDAGLLFRIHWGAHCADALRALHWKLFG